MLPSMTTMEKTHFLLMVKEMEPMLVLPFMWTKYILVLQITNWPGQDQVLVITMVLMK